MISQKTIKHLHLRFKKLFNLRWFVIFKLPSKLEHLIVKNCSIVCKLTDTLKKIECYNFHKYLKNIPQNIESLHIHSARHYQNPTFHIEHYEYPKSLKSLGQVNIKFKEHFSRIPSQLEYLSLRIVSIPDGVKYEINKEMLPPNLKGLKIEGKYIVIKSLPPYCELYAEDVKKLRIKCPLYFLSTKSKADILTHKHKVEYYKHLYDSESTLLIVKNCRNFILEPLDHTLDDSNVRYNISVSKLKHLKKIYSVVPKQIRVDKKTNVKIIPFQSGT